MQQKRHTRRRYQRHHPDPHPLPRPIPAPNRHPCGKPRGPPGPCPRRNPALSRHNVWQNSGVNCPPVLCSKPKGHQMTLLRCLLQPGKDTRQIRIPGIVIQRIPLPYRPP